MAQHVQDAGEPKEAFELRLRGRLQGETFTQAHRRQDYQYKQFINMILMTLRVMLAILNWPGYYCIMYHCLEIFCVKCYFETHY